MGLRLILVSLVASMGFELPTSQEVQTWSRSGREWVAARVGEFSAPLIGEAPAEAVEAPTIVAESPEKPEPAEADPVDDLTFEVVVEGMAVRFGDEFEIARAEAARIEAATVAIAEPADEVEPLAPNVGLVEAEELVASDMTHDDASLPPAEGLAAAPAEPGRIDRLSNAVQLTRKAVAAWACLIQVSDVARVGDEVVLSR
ncbi:hypothetical protein TA3x_001283 [Tundrisphaera sp. TA3]|uniref:hypothetical protein n=1 Tax=Tundrisphaera sp. TA3 TaxID=3435775 RepID=UPI003EB9E59E